MNEDQILSRIQVEEALASLEPADAAMMRLIFGFEKPDDWKGRWPPKYEDVGRYIGNKFEDGPLSEAAIRYRRDVVLEQLRGVRGPLRRINRQESK